MVNRVELVDLVVAADILRGWVVLAIHLLLLQHKEIVEVTALTHHLTVAAAVVEHLKQDLLVTQLELEMAAMELLHLFLEHLQLMQEAVAAADIAPQQQEWVD